MVSQDPPGACDGQAICAGKLEFIGTSRCHIHAFRPPTQLLAAEQTSEIELAVRNDRGLTVQT
jgi:hypothetical protein